MLYNAILSVLRAIANVIIDIGEILLNLPHIFGQTDLRRSEAFKIPGRKNPEPSQSPEEAALRSELNLWELVSEQFPKQMEDITGKLNKLFNSVGDKINANNGIEYNGHVSDNQIIKPNSIGTAPETNSQAPKK